MTTPQDPPIIEMALVLQFEPLPALNVVDGADLFRLFEFEFPTLQQVQPVSPLAAVPQVAQPDAMGQSIQITFQVDHPLRRLWFISEDQHLLIQFQQDRIGLNWRRQGPLALRPEYPGYHLLCDKFLEIVSRASQFFESRSMGPLTPNFGEVSFWNVIPLVGDQGGSRRLSEVFSFFQPNRVAPISSFRTEWEEAVGPGVNGQAHVVATAGASPTGQPAAMLQLSGRFQLQGVDQSNLRQSYDIVRGKLHDLFKVTLKAAYQGKPQP